MGRGVDVQFKAKTNSNKLTQYVLFIPKKMLYDNNNNTVKQTIDVPNMQQNAFNSKVNK